jgi:hypothetical protein
VDYQSSTYTGLKKTGEYILSRSEWSASKNRSLIPVTNPDEFFELLETNNNGFKRFVFDEEPDRYYTNIHDFIEEYLIIKLARI